MCVLCLNAWHWDRECGTCGSAARRKYAAFSIRGILRLYLWVAHLLKLQCIFFNELGLLPVELWQSKQFTVSICCAALQAPPSALRLLLNFFSLWPISNSQSPSWRIHNLCMQMFAPLLVDFEKVKDKSDSNNKNEKTKKTETRTKQKKKRNCDRERNKNAVEICAKCGYCSDYFNGPSQLQTATQTLRTCHELILQANSPKGMQSLWVDIA